MNKPSAAIPFSLSKKRPVLVIANDTGGGLTDALVNKKLKVTKRKGLCVTFSNIIKVWVHEV